MLSGLLCQHYHLEIQILPRRKQGIFHDALVSSLIGLYNLVKMFQQHGLVMPTEVINKYRSPSWLSLGQFMVETVSPLTTFF